MTKILFVINPAGHGGAGIKVWEKLQAEWREQIDSEDVIFTERQGHSREIASSAKGYDILTAVGGDGTVGEIMSGILDHHSPHPKLGIIPAGTGNDIARNLGNFPFERAVDALRGDSVREVDLIRVDCDVEGRMAHRYSYLLAAVGFTAIPMIRPWMKRWLGPTGAYYLATILQMVVYRPPNLTVRWDDQVYSGRVGMVVVGNVERTAGGSMCLSPGARDDDGELHVSIIPCRSKLAMAYEVFPNVASGEHVNVPGVLYFETRKIEIESESPALIDIDGDLFGTTPATFTVCPKAVKVLSRAG